VNRARDVRLGSLEGLLDVIGDRPVPAWNGRRHYSGPAAQTARYLLVLDTVNFSFWGGSAGGYWQLAERLRDVFARGSELSEPAGLATITAARLGELVGNLPMLVERAEALRELGEHGFDGLIQDTAAGTAAALAAALASYADVAMYAGTRVPLLKRAQIAAADLNGAGVVSFPDLSALTCFPDYKLPQVLRHFGVIRYSPALARRVDGWEELRAGEASEVEIRAATVVAVERLVVALRERGRRLLAVELDWILWALSQGLYPVRPHHRTRSVFY